MIMVMIVGAQDVQYSFGIVVQDDVYVDVEVDDSQLMADSSHVNLQVNVTGEGEELEPGDNILSMTLRLAAQANLTLLG